MKMFFEGIGEIVFQKNARSRSLKITVRPFEGVKVTVPHAVSYDAAANFVSGKTKWIENSVKKIREVEKQTIKFRPDIPFRTKYHEMHLYAHEKKTYNAYTKGHIFYFFYPDKLEVTHPEVQDNIKKGIYWLLRKEAKAYLPFRVAHLAEKHGFSYNNVSVKNQKSRWGSCSYKNNINLNIHLMRLPDHLIDYVILHELVHTVHKNHGKDFWKKLDELTGNAGKLRIEMRKFRIF